jgi:hypothetical protein
VSPDMIRTAASTADIDRAWRENGLRVKLDVQTNEAFSRAANERSESSRKAAHKRPRTSLAWIGGIFRRSGWKRAYGALGPHQPKRLGSDQIGGSYERLVEVNVPRRYRAARVAKQPGDGAVG